MKISVSDIAAQKAKITGKESFFELDDLVIEGRSFKIYKYAPRTIIEILQNARIHGELDFIVFEGRRYSYTQFFAEVDALAASLQCQYNITQGDRVAIAMRNNPEWAIAFCAAVLAGAIVVPINSWGKTEELQYAISDCDASVLFCDQARFDLIAGVFERMNLEAILLTEQDDFSTSKGTAQFDAVVAWGRGRNYEIVEAMPGDSAVILYTSGSTGFPKGVLHLHVAIGQSLMNMMYLGMLVTALEGGPREYRGGAERETPLLTVPLFHATGLLSGLIMPLCLCHKVVMMYKWDTLTALKLVQDERVTGLSSVPAIIQDILQHPEFDNYNTESLIRMSTAGAATPAGLPELMDLKTGGCSRSAGYGMTETLAVGSTMSGGLYDLRPDSAGLPSPIMNFRFTNPDGTIAEEGEPGEIEMYGICCTTGYWGQEEATLATISKDGWLKSGDIGHLDGDGFLHITGRSKEIVIRGGENIFPGEIEQAAYEMEGVREVVVFGEPDQAMGEEMVMVVYPAPGSELQESHLRAFLKDRLASYKVPRTIRFWGKPLPRNASEKLHKMKVKEIHLIGQGSEP